MRIKMRPKKRRGFTLVEMLIVTTLLVILVSGLYAAFRVGLDAFRKTEEKLVKNSEVEIFISQLTRELRAAVPYGPQPFLGKNNSIVFPAWVNKYTPKGIEHELYVVEYRFEHGELVRSEHKLRQDFKKSKGEKELLFEKLDDGRFQFLFLNQGGEFEWRDEWPESKSVGLPRGIRVELSGEGLQAKEQSFNILIPHGLLLEQYR
ncbi:MAG: prepilin-type N-terminal cleavage/methylation domain-containing protein [Candidatus Omnitrophica bacterium]|nr:prepilin-type N-terminal cleavage/methylation domain-containing protein [Candidatus Omnitrophota bacterium]